MEDHGENIIPLFHPGDDRMDEQVLFTEQYMEEEPKSDDSISSENEFILNSNCTLGRKPLTKSSLAAPEDAITQSRQRQAYLTLPGLMFSVKQDISNCGFNLDGLGNNNFPSSPELLARDNRDLTTRVEAARSNMPLQRDYIRVEGQQLRNLIDERLKSLLKSRDSLEFEENCLFTELSESNSDNPSTKGNWSDFVTKMATSLGIANRMTSSTVEEKSYMASHLLPTSEPAAIELPLDGSVIKKIKEVDNEWKNKQRVRYCKTSDIKKYTVTEDHGKLYCSPPTLDEDIGEGILPTRRKPSQFNFMDKSSTTTNACLKKLDSGARLLLKQSSYGALMISYLDQLQSEEGRQEVIKNLSELFLAMADVSARIAANSVSARRSLYLRDLAFKNKATEKKLLCLSTLGPNIFGGKFFEVLQGSANNLRNAKETQHTRFNTQASLKRRREPSSDRGEDRYPHNDIKKIKIESSSTRGRRVIYPHNQKIKSDDNQTRFRKGAGFKPSQQ